MIVLTLEPGEAEKLAEGAPGLQRRLRHADRPGALPAPRVLRAGVPRGRRRAAARARAPRRRCCGACACARCSAACSTTRTLIAAAARDAGLDPDALARVVRDRRRSRPRCRRTSTAARARRPRRARWTTSSAARASERRYTAPSYELAAPRTARRGPRLQPGRGLRDGDRQPRARAERRPKPASVDEVLAWARRAAGDRRGRGVARLDAEAARAELSARRARRSPPAPTSTGPPRSSTSTRRSAGSPHRALDAGVQILGVRRVLVDRVGLRLHAVAHLADDRQTAERAVELLR